VKKGKLTKWQVDEILSRQNGKLMKWYVDEIANCNLMKEQVEKITN
jgi:hypothetical protein